MMLANTDRPILEIAGQFGYDNGSKFAKAFRDVMGASPTGFRAQARTGRFFNFFRICTKKWKFARPCAIIRTGFPQFYKKGVPLYE